MGVVIDIPQEALALMGVLEGAGHGAWVVGGCVRDSLLGATPADWDICTPALPGQVAALLGGAGYTVLPTGERHGTVSVPVGGSVYEVTTLRTDGAYADGRHPDAVVFVPNLRKDLARRDFTVNAMAYSPAAGLVDPFGGQADLRAKCLRCVGEADRRFEEDALRILRALRFASKLGFAIQPDTGAAIHKNAWRLKNISAERIFTELKGLLCGGAVRGVLLDYPDVLGVFMPEILPMVGFCQHNPHHCLDVWGHTAKAVAAVPPQAVLRLTMLLHDIGKPATFTMDEAGVGHFYGHQQASEEIARDILARLRASGEETCRVAQLVRWHDAPVLPEKLPRWLNRLGEEGLRQLLQVKRADAMGQAKAERAGKLAAISALEAELEEVLRSGRCFKLKDLAVDGRDLLAMGYASGPALGRALAALLGQVLDGTLPNERQALLARAGEMKEVGV